MYKKCKNSKVNSFNNSGRHFETDKDNVKITAVKCRVYKAFKIINFTTHVILKCLRLEPMVFGDIQYRVGQLGK